MTPGRPAGRRRAAAAAAVPPAPRRLAGGGGPDPARAAGQAADPRDAPADGARWRWPSGFGSVRRFNETFQQLFGRPPARCAARAARTAGRGRRRGHLRLPYRPPYDWAAMIALPGRAGRSRASSGSARDRYARTIEIDGARGVVRGGARRPATPCGRRSASRSCRRLPAIIARMRRVFDLAADPAADRRAPGAGSGAGAAGRGAAGPARARRLGRLRAGGARGPGPADHGDRRGAGWPASWSRPTAQPLADATGDRGPDARLPEPRGAGRRGPRRARHAAQPARAALSGSLPRRSPTRDLFDRDRGLEEAVDTPASALPRRRRMDGAVHRLARAARARRFSRGRHRPDARHRRPRTAAPLAHPSCSPAPSVAALARLRRPASVGFGLSEPGGGAIRGIHST